MQTNILGTRLKACSTDPLTGYFRDGVCRTAEHDAGTHTVCAVMTDAFLDYTRSMGNDLSTPMPAYGFPGLKAGDRWCLCALRWKEAHEAGCAPLIDPEATSMHTLRFVDKEVLMQYSI
jgi:uncharacterized protein (DUF2237 family)